MIQTAGYDLFVQLHEKMLNKALAMAFHAGKLQIEEGHFNLVEKTNLPSDFAAFSQFTFDVSLTNEPFVDLKGKDEFFIRCGSMLRLNLFGCVNIYFSLDFNIAAKIKFNVKELKFQFELNHVKILNIGAQHEYYVSQKFIKALNHIVYEFLDTYFRNKVKTIDLCNIKKLGLEELKDKFDILKSCDVRILNDKSIIAGLSFISEKGNLNKAVNCLSNTDCYVAVSEAAAKEILNYWWTNKDIELKTDFSTTADINFASGAVGQTTDTLTRVFTLGFIETNTDFDEMKLFCDGTIAVTGSPTLNFTEEGGIEVQNLEFTAEVNIRIDALQTQSVTLDKSSFIPDSWTKFEDDVHISTKTEQKTLVNTQNTFKVSSPKVGAILKFKSNPNDGSVTVKVTDVEFKVEFGKKNASFSEATWNKLMSLIKKYIIEKIPEFTVSPALITTQAKVLDKYHMLLANSNLEVNKNGFAISTDVNAQELIANEVAIPNYIVDTKTKTVHSFDCKDVYKILPGYRGGYYVMYEALSKGFKPCCNCLKGYTLAD